MHPGPDRALAGHAVAPRLGLPRPQPAGPAPQPLPHDGRPHERAHQAAAGRGRDAPAVRLPPGAVAGDPAARPAGTGPPDLTWGLRPPRRPPLLPGTRPGPKAPPLVVPHKHAPARTTGRTVDSGKPPPA